MQQQNIYIEWFNIFDEVAVVIGGEMQETTPMQTISKQTR